MLPEHARRVVIRCEKFKLARLLADYGIPFVFERTAGPNTVGKVSAVYVTRLGEFLADHPEFEGRFARHASES